MRTQAIISDRRQHIREGTMAEIENLTYEVLRRYEVDVGTEQRSPDNTRQNAA